ncbi:MAG: hypothetical protein ABI591_12410 [Kofleriaceae bacterium]
MMKALALILALPLVGCVVGSGGMPAPGGGDDTMGSGGSGTTMNGLSGHITTSTTLTGAQAITGALTIDPGVTVTVMAGAAITVLPSASITVAGTLDIEGASGAGVTIGASTGTSFGGIDVPSGGVLTMKYTTVTGTEVSTSTSGTTTISDSHLSNSPGDLIIMGGGSVTLMYSQLGVEAPASDTTHCNMHFGGTGNVIKVSHTNITNTPATNPSAPTFGIMFYAGQAADFTYDNWVSNSTNVEPDPGVSGDFSNSYFMGTAPSAAGLTVGTPAAARLDVCNGTNDAVCAGVHP